MNSQIEKTRLWSNSLGLIDTDPVIKSKKQRLQTVLQRFREHVGVLTTKIAAEFPQLTIHDVTHLDALWETADLIAGDDYPLNPMEAFVLGGAILLHDAANCFEAYEGGQDGVRGTMAWKDAYASEIANNPEKLPEEIKQCCDFIAIRLLHADQAKELGERGWRGQNDADSIFLIEDLDLRSKYGALIGQIAASHNWSIDDVKSQLRNQVNAPGGWPNEWRVDPVKIACLLRCADAAHLDDRRAPDFLFALLQRSNISLDHWKAQNWLARVDVDQSDPTRRSLLFTSSHAFSPSDANAWWVAYDAIAVLDAEISASNKLLSSRVQGNNGSPAFQIQRVSGANSPYDLNKSIETDGWTPTSAKIHVGNLERLVNTLGGQGLYGQGDNFAVVMRELIQNARDAIVARMSLAPTFTGKILIKITRKSSTQTFVEVQDDGVGMSERTMTSALLDFGTSFWASDLVRSEYPGLRSSSFKPVGKFGIGFYAVFMVTSEVLVASRRFDEGISDVTRLSFPDGLTLRPILTKGADNRYNVQFTTSVRITIDEPIDNVKAQWINKGQPEHEWRAPLKNYLAAITAGLDVPVALQIETENLITIHEAVTNDTSPEKIFNWIKDITFFDAPDIKFGNNTQDYVSKNYNRIKNIIQDGKLIGRAALLDTEPHAQLQFLTTDTIGGLTNQVSRGANGFLGYMENYPASAKRDVVGKIASTETLQVWASEQISILKRNNATREQMYWAASHMSNLNLDSIDAINFPVVQPDQQYVLLTFEEIFNLLRHTSIACLKSRQNEFAEINLPPIILDGLPTLRPLGPGNLIRANFENGRPKYSESLLGCLDRLILQKGFELIYEHKPTQLQTMFGPMDALIIRLKS